MDSNSNRLKTYWMPGLIKAIRLVNVICRLIQNKDITVLNPNNAPKHILEFQLQDVTGATISCILWNDLAKKLHQYIKNHEHSTEPIIVLIIMARLSTWNRVTQVSNCFAGSKLLINEDNQHIKAFKDMFESTNLSSNEKTKVELSSNTLVRKPEDYYSQFPLMTIDELYDLSEPTGCVVIGKVLKIVNDQGWYYTICSKCNSVVKPLDAEQSERDYNCENCKKKADLFPRIKIQIRVQDDTGSTSFCLFQQDVTKVLGKSVTYLISKIDKASQSDSNEKALAERVTMKNNIESHKIDMEKKPIVEHQDSKDDTVNKLTDDNDVMISMLSKQTEEEECKTSAEGRTKRKNNEAGNSDIPKKSKVDHQETKAEII
ncbi:nucleic acid-binding, OB-fold protein [Tanacetum coccineum]